jgi:hypothetical protein
VLHDDTLLTERPYSRRFPSTSPPLALDVEGLGRASIVALNTSGIIAALRGDGRVPEGWPLATGSGVRGAALAADLDRDGHLELVAPDRPVETGVPGLPSIGNLYAFSLPADTASAVVSAWTMLGGDPARTCWLPAARTTVAPSPHSGPLAAGSLKAYPNPARQRPVTIAYTLTEPARVEFRILDTSGHQVASFARDGRIADNLEIWEPGAVPAGLYMVHVRIRAQDSETTQVVPVGILK